MTKDYQDPLTSPSFPLPNSKPPPKLALPPQEQAPSFHGKMKGFDESQDSLLEKYCQCGSEKRESRGSIRSWLASHGFSLAILTLLVYIAVLETVKATMPHEGHERHDASTMKPDRYTLMADTLEFEERTAWTHPQHPWNLPPSPELDEAWEDLLWPLDIRITEDEAHMLDLNLTHRVQVNGGDYIGVLGVFHSLHCLNNMRIAMHWDDYYEPIYRDYDHPEVFSKPHNDHCIDTIRQSLMCHAGNVEVHTAEWLEDDSGPEDKVLAWQSTSTCLKWDTLDTWARPRALKPGKFSFRPGPFNGGNE